MLDDKCKKCRAVGEKLFLKGERCFTPKCALIRRGIRVLGKRRRRKTLTSYGKQLLEKQKVKLAYGMREKQFRRYFKMALKKKISTPEALAQLIENRFDNTVFRLGFTVSRTMARHLVSHGHFFLNGRKHNISSTIVKKEDVISIRPQSSSKVPFKDIKERLKKYSPPKHLKLDMNKIEGKVMTDPDLEELQLPFDFTSIVEFYSR
ncbi:MAG: 30S ribosomal protein S4 [Candidatus Pacebacteria bacterium]|nr:30S ribosomal protein S4 [Candidatus Paceibacterota bacterium]